jgi:hypothetical protein
MPDDSLDGLGDLGLDIDDDIEAALDAASEAVANHAGAVEESEGLAAQQPEAYAAGLLEGAMHFERVFIEELPTDE